MTASKSKVIYVGMTSNLIGRIGEHKEKKRWGAHPQGWATLIACMCLWELRRAIECHRQRETNQKLGAGQEDCANRSEEPPVAGPNWRHLLRNCSSEVEVTQQIPRRSPLGMTGWRENMPKNSNEILPTPVFATHTPQNAATPRIYNTYKKTGGGQRLTIIYRLSAARFRRLHAVMSEQTARTYKSVLCAHAVILRRNRSGSDEESRVCLEVDWLWAVACVALVLERGAFSRGWRITTLDSQL